MLSVDDTAQLASSKAESHTTSSGPAVQYFIPQFTSPSVIELKNTLLPDPSWAPKVRKLLSLFQIRSFEEKLVFYYFDHLLIGSVGDLFCEEKFSPQHLWLC